MTAHRKARGRESERIVADYLAAHGWPFAEPVGAGRAGSDVTGVPGLDIEAKARRGFNPVAAMKQQAERCHPGDLPFTVLRMDGQGPASIEDWPVVLPLGMFVGLLREAGYGEGWRPQ